ncbi:uncharacterized protein [Montipora capricornis]|uniref:uncharacterized protein isoform X4 n=1 Tax=Montipora capricornis TaxID=246305 RepID=UPI0035F15B52
MPPTGRGRKRPSSVSNLVDEIRAEVEQSVTVEKAALDAYRVFTSTSMNVDTMRALPSKVVDIYLSVKYSKDLLVFLSTYISQLRALPESIRNETVAKLSGLSIQEVPILLEGCSLVEKTSNLERLQNCSVGNFPVLLTPPTSTCFACSRMLLSHNKPCNVAVYTLCGKRTGLKFSLRCEHCQFNYNYDRYGNKSVGWCLYQNSRPLVEATDVCFVDRNLLEFQCALANHSWVSFSGFATAFNEAFKLLEGDEGYGEKQCSSAFWNGELETELRDLGRLDFFGLMKLNADREKVMQGINSVRAKSVYSHSSDDCSPECKKRGCGKLWVVDGQWKLMFAHCMMRRKNVIRGLPLVNYPDVCTNSPQSGKAFCVEHMKFLNEKYPDVPTDIHGFLRYCGIQRENTGDDSDPSSEEILDKEVSKVEKVLSSLGNGPTSDVGNSVVEAQGNSGFIEREHGALSTLLQDCVEPQPTSCNKETGGKQRLQKWSRGLKVHLKFS